MIYNGKSVLIRTIFYEGHSYHIIKNMTVIEGDSSLEVFENDIKTHSFSSKQSLCNYLISEMTNKFYASISIDTEISNILYESEIAQNNTVLENSGAMVFLTSDFNKRDVYEILEGINEEIEKNIKSKNKTYDKIDDDLYDGPDYIKGIIN